VGQVWLENNAKLLFQDALRINQGNDSAGSANGLCPLAFEKSYLTLVAPKKPKRFCGAEVFETSVLAHEVELAAADCEQSA
jgi:hypothetical protein